MSHPSSPSSLSIVIGTLIEANGTHAASWLFPGARDDAPTNVDYFRDIARLAERGKLDFIFFADTPAARTDDLVAWSRAPMYMNMLEPITLLAALAGSTSRIGLGATASTSFFEPYNLARQFASLDHISRGRIAWNVVTSANDYAARNFGLDRLPPHDRRYEKARECLSVVKRLWDSWEDDAFINDREACLNFVPEKQHAVSHQGEFFTVQGALNIARPPQGYPVIMEAGASEAGKEFAAETAEVVFGTGSSKDRARAFYQDLKGRMAKYGRDPDSLKVLSGVSIVVGENEDDARRKLETWQDLIHPDATLLRIKQDLETDLSDLPLDEPVPVSRIPASSNHHQVYFEEIARMIREGMTLREICRKYNRSRVTFCGSAVEIADQMEAWVRDGASDGFLITLQALPGDLADLVEQVVPELQRRGLFRSDYTGRTLREHLGLARPENANQVCDETVATTA